jgi:hypothetical protein
MRRPTAKVVATLVALVFAGVVGSCSLIPAPALTADEWDWCRLHWRDGLDSPQRDEPNGSTWYFTHMGTRDDADTIRVCRAAFNRR